MHTGLWLVIVACAMSAISGCAGGAEPQADTGEAMRMLRAHAWTPVEIDGAAVAADEMPPSITFDEDRITGTTGVNRLSGPYTAVPFTPRTGMIAFGALVTTRMAGPPEAMAVESALLKAIDAIETFTIEENGHVTFKNIGGDVVLRFEPAH